MPTEREAQTLSGKTAIVTGASRGIGLAIAQALAREGVRVVAAARERTDELAALANDYDARAVSTDLVTSGAPEKLIEDALSFLGQVDILVNNIGALKHRSNGVLSVTDEEWAWSFDVNFFVAVRTVRSLLPHLIERGSGNIITISSVNSFLPDPALIDYTSAKAALSNFSKALSKQVARQGIRVNTVSPGPVETPMWFSETGFAATAGRATNVSASTFAANAAEAIGTGRFTRPEEVADLVVFLASDLAQNITGSDFVIDGGLITTWR